MVEDSPLAVVDTTEPSNENTVQSVKAIIFDMDGTLLDTESLSDKALLKGVFCSNDNTDDDKNECSLPESIRSQSPYSEWRLPWELKQQILGLRGNEWSPITLDYFRERHPPEVCQRFPTVTALIDAWEKHLNDMCTEIDACPGAKALVGAIANASSKPLPMAIATSSRMSGVAKKRTRHEPQFFEHLSAIVAGDDPAVKKGKPAPDIYLEAARRLGVDPADCLVFEDALSGVKAGKAAGCKVVAVPDPRFSPKERQKVFTEDGQADVVLESLWDFDGRPFGMDLNMAEILRTQE